MATNSVRHYRLIFYVPRTHAEICKQAIFATGAGVYGDGRYIQTAFEIPGTAQFMPAEGANPNIGEVGKLEKVDEVKVETTCNTREILGKAIEALKKAHPYEVAVYEAYEVLDL